MQNRYKKSPPFWEALLFVFAFFITRRNASQSGEGKKECEEKHFIDHRYWRPVLIWVVNRLPLN
ncbi:hypothetical protein CS535_09845 [Yersinia massiliensis]|uniref:Uncharacterized protein n=1 Tax=Yersinia massiliensis TaxID=419257 RepID=A0ABM6UXQ8_9GAMM|nr:hypothetical protein DA391_17485 [Yersinia massiliensis]OWF74015.1 hypothetical protein B4902_04090 [Yersinia frederiksenii]PHZ23636.1 hypothetical protein CS535_09845 [Yersinia massiliensis]